MQKEDAFFDVLLTAKPVEKKEDMRVILMNAIKMQALYSEGKVKFVETSEATH